MKVIKEGNYNNAFPKRITCERIIDEYGFGYGKEKDFCGSILEIEETDIKKHPWSKYPDYSGVDYGVICPICGKFVPVKDIPKAIMDKAEEVSIG